MREREESEDEEEQAGLDERNSEKGERRTGFGNLIEKVTRRISAGEKSM